MLLLFPSWLYRDGGVVVVLVIFHRLVPEHRLITTLHGELKAGDGGGGGGIGRGQGRGEVLQRVLAVRHVSLAMVVGCLGSRDKVQLLYVALQEVRERRHRELVN